MFADAAKLARELEDVETGEESNSLVTLSRTRQTYHKKDPTPNDYDQMFMQAQQLPQPNEHQTVLEQSINQLIDNNAAVQQQGDNIPIIFGSDGSEHSFDVQDETIASDSVNPLTVPTLDMLNKYMATGSDSSASKSKN